MHKVLSSFAQIDRCSSHSSPTVEFWAYSQFDQSFVESSGLEIGDKAPSSISRAYLLNLS